MKLIIKNKLYIQGADPELKGYLKDILTIDNPKWVEAQTFGRWTRDIPRQISQYGEEGNQVVLPRGVLVHLLEDLGRDFEILDQRVSPPFLSHPPGGSVSLRPEDQEAAVRDLLRYKSGFLSAPAGSGKTIMGLEVCRRLGLRTLWLTHRGNLVDQVAGTKKEPEGEAFLVMGLRREDVGILHGAAWKLGDQLTVGMIPTLRNRDLSDIVKAFGLVIVDEAHHVPSNSFLDIVERFHCLHTYGLTATAYRSDKLEPVMFNAVGPIVARIQHVELFQDEHLIKPTIKIRHTGWLPPNSTKLEYNDFMEQMVMAPARNSLIVEDVVRECKPGNTAIVLVDRTKHAEVLTDLLKKRGIRCEFVVGSVDINSRPGDKRKRKKFIPQKIRDKIVSDFKQGKIQVLIATYDLLAEGFNYRPLNILFMVAPVKYRGTVIQAIGRVQRPSEGKPGALVYDYVDSLIPMFGKQADARMSRVYRAMDMPVEDPNGDFYLTR